MQPTALFVNESVAIGLQMLLKSQKIKVSMKVTKTQSRIKKNMSDSLRTICLFIAHYLAVNEFVINRTLI